MDKKTPGVSAALKYLANSSDPADVVSGELLQERLNDYSVELSTWKKTARDLKKERDELARALGLACRQILCHEYCPINTVGFEKTGTQCARECIAINQKRDCEPTDKANKCWQDHFINQARGENE